MYKTWHCLREIFATLYLLSLLTLLWFIGGAIFSDYSIWQCLYAGIAIVIFNVLHKGCRDHAIRCLFVSSLVHIGGGRARATTLFWSVYKKYGSVHIDTVMNQPDKFEMLVREFDPEMAHDLSMVSADAGIKV